MGSCAHLKRRLFFLTFFIIIFPWRGREGGEGRDTNTNGRPALGLLPSSSSIIRHPCLAGKGHPCIL